MKMRRSRFRELSLARPKSLSMSERPMRQNSCESCEGSKRSSYKTKRTTRNNAALFPPIVLSNGTKKKQRRREVKRITLPDINRIENFKCY